MTLKLAYYATGGAAQPIRILLHVLGQEYENFTYTQNEKWQADKIKMDEDGQHFVNLPSLQDGDIYITESGAIPYYLCQKYNKDLFGKNALDTTRVLQIDGVLKDLNKSMVEPIFSTDKPKETLSNAIADGAKAMKLIEKLAAFLGEKEFLLGYLTYADIILAYGILLCRSLFLSIELEDPFAKHPTLLKLAKRVYEHDALKGYAESDKYFTFMDASYLPWYKEHPLP